MTTAAVHAACADGEDYSNSVREFDLMKPHCYIFYPTPDYEADPYDKGVAKRSICIRNHIFKTFPTT